MQFTLIISGIQGYPQRGQGNKTVEKIPRQSAKLTTSHTASEKPIPVMPPMQIQPPKSTQKQYEKNVKIKFLGGWQIKLLLYPQSC